MLRGWVRAADLPLVSAVPVWAYAIIVMWILWIVMNRLGIAWLVLTIMAAMKANEGVAYRYPFTLRLVK